MLKKLLVAVVACSFLASMSIPAMAAKSPNEAKKVVHHLPPGAARINISPTDDRPEQYPPTTIGQRTATPPGMTWQSGTSAAGCSSIEWDCGIASYWGGVTGAAVRYTTAADEACSLKSMDMLFYAAGTVLTTASGITAYVWNDDGFGLPGSVIFSVNIPDGSIIYYTSATTVDLAPANIVIPAGTSYHGGYIENDVTDGYAPLSDNGSCGVARSSIFDGASTWYLNLNALPAPSDFNWVMDMSVCCAGPGPVCTDQVWYNAIVYRWSGGYPSGVRFDPTPNSACTLTTVTFNISSGGQAGTDGVDVSIYDQVAGLPGSVIATQHVPHGSIAIPGATTVTFSPGIDMSAGSVFAVYSITNYQDLVHDYQLRSDDGTTGTGHSYVFDGVDWFTNFDGFGDDYNWIIDAEVCCTPMGAVSCETLNYSCYNGSGYYWPIPDAYGDDFRNMRFTNPAACTLKTVCFDFYGPGSVGSPGADIYIWNSDGTFPTSVITTVPVNPVTNYHPALECVDVSGAGIVMSGDYHVGYTPIYNSGTDVLALLGDDASCGDNRSVEQWSDASWHLMGAPDNWGLDVNFNITVDVCCEPPGYCAYDCAATDQWPTFAHDYARTSQSQVSLGDICGIALAWSSFGTGTAGINPGATPIVADDKVFIAYDNRLQALDLASGAILWDTKSGGLLAEYSLIINNGLRCSPTYEGGVLYLGTGSLKGFVAVSAATGDTIWCRHQLAGGNPLPGASGVTRFCNSVINGSEIYFGDDNGQIYALDKTTGADLYLGQLLNHDGNPRSVNSSPAWDGSRLYFATGIASTGTSTDGDVYGVTPSGGSFTQDWMYTPATEAIEGAGFSSSPSFRCDNLFVISAFPFGVDVSTGAYQGRRYDLDPATGADIWPTNFLMGRGFAAPPATIGGANPKVFFANEVGVTATGAPLGRGVRAVNFLNTTVWNNAGTGIADNNVEGHATVTCDPYVLYGTRDFADNSGKMKIVDGNTGVELINYDFTGHMMPAVIATHSSGEHYIVTAERFRDFGATGAGAVYAFKDQGPRPRMVVPELLVEFPGTNTSEPIPVQRTDNDAVLNTGCLTLNVSSATLEAGAPPMKRQITSVNPALITRAQALADNYVDYKVGSLLRTSVPAGVNKIAAASVSYDDATDMGVSNMPAIKPAKANSSRLAPPSWVSWITPFSGGPTASFAVAGGGSQDFTFEFDRSGMALLGQNYFFVELSSDDPDYNPEDPLATPQAVIEYTIPFEYCPYDSGRIAFGNTGSEWYSNRAEFGDGTIEGDFTLDGSDSYLYEGTFFFMNSMSSAAWNIYPDVNVAPDFGYLYPFYYSGTNCGSCDFGTSLPVQYTIDGGNSYSPTTGDVCSFAVIDSLQDAGVNPSQSGPSMGILVKYKEIGTYGADFGSFKLVVVQVTNRNAAPINGLYSGNLEDWDVADYSNNFTAGDVGKGYIYIYEAGTTESRGQIGIPQKGSYWPDGTKTDPMYNGRGLANPDDIYNSNSLDSLYDWINDTPEDVLAYSPNAGPVNPGDDKAYVVAFRKDDLAGNTSVEYGFAVFGLPPSASINSDVEAVADFSNKYAGFGRGDINNDNVIDLRDLVRLSAYVANGTNGPVPFLHLGDVNNDGNVDSADCAYLAAYYFTGGPPPKSTFMFTF